jgi:hypothetical protein
MHVLRMLNLPLFVLEHVCYKCQTHKKQIDKLARMLHVLANEHSIIFKQYANL